METQIKGIHRKIAYNIKIHGAKSNYDANMLAKYITNYKVHVYVETYQWQPWVFWVVAMHVVAATRVSWTGHSSVETVHGDGGSS
jgi:hypothetical protein